MSQEPDRTYLGDGLYAEIEDGFQIKLSADFNKVYLDEFVFSRFIEFAAKNKWLTNKDRVCYLIDHYAKDEEKPRDLVKCLCDTCGTSYEVLYDKNNDEYICKECYEKEDEENGEIGEDDNCT